MKQTSDMPEVTKCEVKGCVYNRELKCHAIAITVGGAKDHQCDTTMISASHCHRDSGAGVGACKVSSCKHNDDFECQTPAIEVSSRGGCGECATFKAR